MLTVQPAHYSVSTQSAIQCRVPQTCHPHVTHAAAAAVCFEQYFGTDASECGGPFCEKMVITLQGIAFYADYAYSYWGMAETDGDCDYVYPYRIAGRSGKDAATGNGAPTNSTATDAASDANRHSTRDRARRAPDRAPVATGRDHHKRDNRRRKPAQKKQALQVGAAHHKYDLSIPDSTKVVAGDATIITGVVTSFTGPMQEKWESGTFEYVPYFDVIDNPDDVAAAGIDSTYPWIRDKAYKFTFFRQAAPY